MITFRCWYCNKAYLVPEARIGETLRCSCGHPLRIPLRNHGNSRIKTWTDRLVEAVVYGGAGAVLGLLLALFLLGRVPMFGMAGERGLFRVLFVFGLTGLGFLLGVLTGEAGINWIGRIVRERQERK
jgi:hypothetical protein